MIAELVQRYGYLAVLVGTFLEGETVLVLGGYAAHRGYLSLPLVIALAFAGSLSGDQLAFWLGRRLGQRILHRWPSWQPRVDRAHDVLRRRGAWLVVSFRFFYGFRNVTPFAIGTTPVSARWFTGLNAVGAALWASVVATLGYLFGHAVEKVLAHAQKYEQWVFFGIVAAGALAWIVRELALRRRKSRG